MASLDINSMGYNGNRFTIQHNIRSSNKIWIWTVTQHLLFGQSQNHFRLDGGTCFFFTILDMSLEFHYVFCQAKYRISRNEIF